MAEAALYDALMQRYGFRRPAELRQALSRAELFTLAEGMFWNTWRPPAQPDQPASPQDPMASLGIAVIEVD